MTHTGSVVVVAVLVGGCGGANGNLHSRTLSTGTQIEVIEVKQVNRDGRETLNFHFQAKSSATDLPALSAEVEEIWGDLQAEAEDAGVEVVVFFAVTGEGGGLVTRSRSFAYEKDSEGVWKALWRD